MKTTKDMTKLKRQYDDAHYRGTNLTAAEAKKAARPYVPCSTAYVQGFLEARRRYRAIENNMREWMRIKDKALSLLKKLYDEKNGAQ
jgi:hypothetical protein